MPVSQQPRFVSRDTDATADTPSTSQSDTLHADVLQLLIVAGRRDADPAAVTRAVLACWHWLGCRTVRRRETLHATLRAAIAGGRTTVRAWLPLAVAEIDPVLLRAAVTGYLGAAPRSVEQREQAVVDACEWFRRSLTLDRVAVFEALLAQRDEAINARLVALRGRLDDAERARVLAEFASATDAPTRAFLEAWRDDFAQRAGLPQPV